MRPVAQDNLPANGRPLVVARLAPLTGVGANHPPVTHTYAALAFQTGGQMRLEQDGEWIVGEGDVLLVPAGAAHRRLETKQAQAWGLGFCVPCFAANGAAALLEPFERVRDGGAAVVHVPAARHAYLESLFRELERGTQEDSAANDAFDTVQRSLLTLILNEVVQAAGKRVAVRASSSSVVIDALRFIERNCLRRLTLNEVAGAVRRSPAYVTSALKQATGRSAGEWIVAGRMAEARRLLSHSGERVDVIAERVGYADPTHFIRMFRRAHGVTPAAWRTQVSRSL